MSEFSPSAERFFFCVLPAHMNLHLTIKTLHELMLFCRYDHHDNILKKLSNKSFCIQMSNMEIVCLKEAAIRLPNTQLTLNFDLYIENPNFDTAISEIVMNNIPVQRCFRILEIKKYFSSLRRLSESLILIGSAMFGATFNLVTHVGIP